MFPNLFWSFKLVWCKTPHAFLVCWNDVYTAQSAFACGPINIPGAHYHSPPIAHFWIPHFKRAINPAKHGWSEGNAHCAQTRWALKWDTMVYSDNDSRWVGSLHWGWTLINMFLRAVLTEAMIKKISEVSLRGKAKVGINHERIIIITL